MDGVKRYMYRRVCIWIWRYVYGYRGVYMDLKYAYGGVCMDMCT